MNSDDDDDDDAHTDYHLRQIVRKTSPVEKLIELEILNRMINEDDPNDSLWNALLKFRKERFDRKVDTTLATLALCILKLSVLLALQNEHFQKQVE